MLLYDYKEDGDLKHTSIVLISGNLAHETVAVYKYQKIIQRKSTVLLMLQGRNLTIRIAFLICNPIKISIFQQNSTSMARVHVMA